MRIFVSKILSAGLLLAGAATVSPAFAVDLTVTMAGVKNGHFAQENVWCLADGKGQANQNGGNKSPAITWTKGPAATTKSYAVLMVDPDVPADFGPANKAGQTIAANAPRRDFYHWMLIGIPANRAELAAGDGNKYAQTFGTAKPADMKPAEDNLASAGYVGPCPPWNDMRAHTYHLHVYALDVAKPDLTEPFDGAAFLQAIKGHVLAEGETTAAWTTTAALAKAYEN